MPIQKTIDSWRSYIRKFCAFLGHDDAARMTGADVVRWKDSLVSSGLSASTINNKHMSALRVALGYGKDNRKLPDNVALGVSALAPRRGGPKKRGYTDGEALTVLSAARKFTGWRRWLVFIVAYTGARVSEPADAMADDIKVSPEGVPFIDLTERVLKNDSSPRRIPLHPRLIAEGFLEYAQGLPRGGPLFPDCPPSATYQLRGATASKVIARWVRNDLGIKDTRIQPSHAWRHRMATLHRNAAIPEDASRYLRGYADQDDADHYGTHSLVMLAAHMAKIPAQG
ncbi:MAG: site-specific integrase [Nevskia sp.]|nr:site-specific integrase [Nevskia sp.]